MWMAVTTTIVGVSQAEVVVISLARSAHCRLDRMLLRLGNRAVLAKAFGVWSCHD